MSNLGASRRLQLSIAAATAAACLVALGPPAAAEGEMCNGVAATIVGAGAISGTAGKDVIVGSSGDDVIDAGAGDDTICAGEGSDEVSDGNGKDKVFLEGGNDTAIAYPLRDVKDVFDGGTGIDTADYSARATRLKLNLNAFADNGAQGEADRLPAMENVIGGSNSDTITGNNGPNGLEGGAGADRIMDLRGADTVDAGPGNDTVVQPREIDWNDTFDGGDGVDEIDYAARPADHNGTVTMDLDSTYGTSGHSGELDILTAFENARGGPNDDRVIGTDGPNVIKVSIGYSWIEALGGNDTIITGNGIDQVSDGPGSDLVSTGGNCDRIVQDDYSTDNIQAGGGGCDVVRYSLRTEDLSINLASASGVNGAAGEADVLKGFEHAHGGVGDDVIAGNSGANLLVGGPGADTLAGMAGNDDLRASDGIQGNDAIEGGFGRDFGELDGGDTYIGTEETSIQ